MDLKNRVVFITGASAGIGEACARGFAKSGAKLVLAARRADRLSSLSAELAKAYKTDCLALELDVTDRSAAGALPESLPEGYREVSVLVNNAGGAKGLEPLSEGSHDDWDWMIDTNLKGLLNVTRALLPGMLARNEGHIINIGSIAGRMVYPNGAVYCATKFAERALSQGLLMELVNTPLRVTTIDPGLVETEFSLVRFKGDAERARTVYNGLQPLTAEDVASAVVWAASQPARVTVAEMVILPTAQASPFHLNRG